jgi:hypothetical protein
MGGCVYNHVAVVCNQLHFCIVVLLYAGCKYYQPLNRLNTITYIFVVHLLHGWCWHSVCAIGKTHGSNVALVGGMANNQPTTNAPTTNVCPCCGQTTPNTLPPVATITYRRQHPGGGALGRCSYGIAGCKGIVVWDMGLFAPVNGTVTAPATLTIVGATLAQPVVNTGATVTSAVVAQANTNVANNTGNGIAQPAQVAQVASAKAAEVVAASTPVAKPTHGVKQTRTA